MARRARISPQEAGLAPGVRRRTPGLRREEVAVLAGVGSSWYQWLEQGRAITVSAQVLEAIGRVLRLDEPEVRHLYALAGLNPPPARVAPRPPDAQSVDQALVRLVDAWLPNPGHIVDRYWNVVLGNRSAELALAVGQPDANGLTMFFLEGMYRDSIDNWEELAPRVVAQYRSEMTACPGDPGFHYVVGDLLARSPEFAELWARRDVQNSEVNLKDVMHPVVGLLRFESTLLAVPGHGDLRIALHNPVAGTDTPAKLLRLLEEDDRRRGLRLVAQAG
jgi:transcriptional regulator with XRE-family HTH domain